MSQLGYATSAGMVGEEYKIAIDRGQKAKKPNFIKRWINKMVQTALDEHNNRTAPKISMNQLVAASGNHPLDADKAVRFNVYIANGGRIVEVARYDRLKDRHVNGLYVITGDQDFGREIDKILTMEALK